MKLFLTRMVKMSLLWSMEILHSVILPSGVSSGLADALIRFEANSRVGVIKFMQEDCVRSTLCQHVLAAYNN